MAPSITLHHLNLSRSTRIFWALEELGLEYTVKVHFRNAGFRAPDELKKIMPLGSAPIVELDSEILHESAYILTRLLPHAAESSQAELKPSNDSQYWAAFAEGTLMVWMQAGTIIKGTTKGFAGAALGGEGMEGGKKAVEGYADWVQKNMLTPASQNHLTYMNDYLSKHDYFSGTDQPGIGDFMMLIPLVQLMPLAVQQGDGPTETPRGNLEIGQGLRGWWKRVQARPALQKALKRQQDEEEASKSRL